MLEAPGIGEVEDEIDAEPARADAAPGVLPYSEAAGGARVEAARRAARTLRPGVGALS